jgi:hypothetical protein
MRKPFVSEFMSQKVDCITLHGMVNNSGTMPVGEVLRREGLYSTDLLRIREKVKEGALELLTDRLFCARAFPPVKITHPLPFDRDIFTSLASAFRLGLAFRHLTKVRATPVASMRYFDFACFKETFPQRPQSTALLGYLLISLLTTCPNA